MARFCAFDDKPVKPATEAKRQWGKGELPDGYVHATGEGVSNCGRPILTESQTYTEGEVDSHSTANDE